MAQEITLLSGSNSGRKDNECAQIGVRRIAATEGCTIDPPATHERRRRKEKKCGGQQEIRARIKTWK
jgi:hypothetical protein